MAVTSQVMQFYEGAHVLITGGTGFMGRILLEKLLRSCPGVQQVYLIIRVKKNVEPSQRMTQLLDEPVFSVLKTVLPDFHKKVTLVPGDCGELGLGLSAEDRLLLTSNVTHVFHGAATVRFDAPLKRALLLNVRGVREMLLLCQECPNIKSVIHISTAFSNCPIKFIDEKFYDAPITADKALSLLECLDDSQLEAITPELIVPWPNTYSFSKSIAEDVVKKIGKGLPVAVFRPSIVIGCNKEPIPGWIDNVYGPTGVVVAGAAGLLRVMYADPELTAEVVPVDMSINAMICAAWEIGRKSNSPIPYHNLATHAPSESSTRGESSEENSQDISIYNFCSPVENRFTWTDFHSFATKDRYRIPPIQTIWYPTGTTTNSWSWYIFLTFFYHTIPSYAMDAVLVLSGKKPQLVDGYKKLQKFSNVLKYFCTQQWSFGMKNTQRLWSRLSSEDQNNFHFNMMDVEWPVFFAKNFESMRLYIFKDDPSTIPAARRRIIKFAVAHYTLLAVIYSFLAWAFYRISYFILRNLI